MASKVYAFYLLKEKSGGIVDSWAACKAIVDGKKCRYKSFANREAALEWLDKGALYPEKEQVSKPASTSIERTGCIIKEAIYFDAGTGRGIGVEARVTDYRGISLLHLRVPDRINKWGNFLCHANSTNNYGEAAAMYFALEIAMGTGEKIICGDSELVIKYWSKGQCNRGKLDKKTVEMIDNLVKRRKEFEAIGGKVMHISGDLNPSDLGFHK